ncbi:protein of unknown function [Tenacibaculum sp. 190130A14a]|uniref:LPXTG-motif cell wall-anchored protein n=1 Tax=Tenacibaculum polynesiense TaxID=3137857 RepID=A0ABP1F3C8_9FLAO
MKLSSNYLGIFLFFVFLFNVTLNAQEKIEIDTILYKNVTPKKLLNHLDSLKISLVKEERVLKVSFYVTGKIIDKEISAEKIEDKTTIPIFERKKFFLNIKNSFKLEPNTIDSHLTKVILTISEKSFSNRDLKNFEKFLNKSGRVLTIKLSGFNKPRILNDVKKSGTVVTTNEEEDDPNFLFAIIISLLSLFGLISLFNAFTKKIKKNK